MTEKERAAWMALREWNRSAHWPNDGPVAIAITALLDEPQQETPERAATAAMYDESPFPTQDGPTVDEDVLKLRSLSQWLLEGKAASIRDSRELLRIASRLEAATTKAPVSWEAIRLDAMTCESHGLGIIAERLKALAEWHRERT